MSNDNIDPNIDLKKLEFEREKWEYQKQWQKQGNEIELKKLKQAKLDTWIRGLISGILGTAIAVSISASITLYGQKAEKEKTRRAEEQRKQETLIQLVNSRESSDSDLRAQIFNTLLQHYFREKDFRTQIAILEIIGLNFRDALHTKPMFERLHFEIKEKVKNPKEMLEALRKASGRIIADQLQQIKQSIEGDVCEIEFDMDTENCIPQRPQCFQDLVINLKCLRDDHILVQTNSKDGILLEDSEEPNGDVFTVSFYDMPMVDYTSVASKGTVWKYSIVLKEIDQKNKIVKIAIANLPELSFSTSEEFKFDEMLKSYLPQ
jgi:hypothetical protein